MAYLLKVSAIVGLFYLTYKLLLQKDTFFKQNRWFLLFGLGVSFLVPLYVITEYVTYTPMVLSDFTFNTKTTATTKTFNFIDVLPYLYITGVAIFSLRFLLQFAAIFKVIKCPNKRKEGHYIFIESETAASPFSFFNWIVYNPEQFTHTELQQIITHEKIHAKQKHSFDVILANLACVILWFNPFIWLYQKDLKQNLEFLADYSAFKAVSCKKQYQYTLLKQSLPTHQLALSNAFYNSLIKKRIVMLHKSKSNNMNRIKCLAVLPLIALFLMSFNTRTVYVEKEITSETKPEFTTSFTEHFEAILLKNSTEADLNKIKNTLEAQGVTIKFKGLKRNANDEIIAIKIDAKSKTSKANYNINADEAIMPIKISYNPNNETINISGANSQNAIVASFKGNTNKQNETVIIKEENKIQFFSTTQKDSIIYIIDSVKVKKEDAKALEPSKVKSINVIKDEKSLKEYGNIKAIIEILTKDETDTKTSNKTIKIIKGTSGFNGLPKDLLVIVDGKEIDHEKLKDVKKDDIKTVNVLKDEKAIKKYGEKGKNGVIIIETKK
ncbi:M56 family metallopeptidase [Neotamlana laminarinivorans]|uniref:M56 family metallopeptidase n=1 Tax=Neotamlana laminarinivorans TaxID=2883124 RepID=A0A9X1L2Q9_9FLAO|nr:M56 family metallopeptidase [Tamlana laminarinivorans]MCB4797864.1 M56 family metallopeptidase [Tamlana laminarinivorans]